MLVAYVQIPHFNAHAVIFSEAGSLNVSLSRYIHPYFVYTDSEGTDESARLHMLADPSLLNNSISTKISCDGPYGD